MSKKERAIKLLREMENEFDEHYPWCQDTQCIFEADTMIKKILDHDKETEEKIIKIYKNKLKKIISKYESI